jgi:hypothetical protein
MGSNGYELMSVSLKLASLTQSHWYEYAIRFVLGGIMTAIAGWIASEYGPLVGGLFLAFPAIFPASATLVEKHEREKKEKAGLHGKRRGKEAAALEAVGSVMGRRAHGIRHLRVASRRPPLYRAFNSKHRMGCRIGRFMGLSEIYKKDTSSITWRLLPRRQDRHHIGGFDLLRKSLMIELHQCFVAFIG